MRCLSLGLLLLALALAPVGARADLASSTVARELRVLFVGNSYTRFNVMPRLVSRLSGEPDLGPLLSVQSVAHGGYTLRRHWQHREALRRLRRGGFTHVVLQDHSLRPLDRAAEFERYVKRFSHAAAEVGSETVLYETWPRHARSSLYRRRPELQTPQQMGGIVSEAYNRVAHALGAQVAPVGQAFLLTSHRRPDIDLYRADGTHPTFAGSFLAACVIYGALTGRDPGQTAYVPWELSAEQAHALRELASATLAAAR